MDWFQFDTCIGTLMMEIMSHGRNLGSCLILSQPLGSSGSTLSVLTGNCFQREVFPPLPREAGNCTWDLCYTEHVHDEWATYLIKLIIFHKILGSLDFANSWKLCPDFHHSFQFFLFSCIFHIQLYVAGGRLLIEFFSVSKPNKTHFYIENEMSGERDSFSWASFLS